MDSVITIGSSTGRINPELLKANMIHKRILIIDDEETIQTVVQFGISIAVGWEVLTASSGNQGIQVARREQPDAILLDLMMPSMDGISTLTTLQSHASTAHIPVIFLTAKDQPPLLHHLEIQGVITKPFNALDLPHQITRILQW